MYTLFLIRITSPEFFCIKCVDFSYISPALCIMFYLYFISASFFFTNIIVIGFVTNNMRLKFHLDDWIFNLRILIQIYTDDLAHKSYYFCHIFSVLDKDNNGNLLTNQITNKLRMYYSYTIFTVFMCVRILSTVEMAKN